MGEVKSVGTVELVCVGRLLKMRCDPFLMSVCGFVGGGETLWKQMGYQWNILVSAGRRGRRGRDKKLNYVGEEGERPS